MTGVRTEEKKKDADDESSEKSAPPPTEKSDPHDIGDVFVNMWLDVKDEVQNWCEAQVIKIDRDEKSILVHYKGWKSKFDEWISLSAKNRLAQVNTKTPGGKRFKKVEFFVKLKLDVKDTQDKWCHAEVVDINNAHKQVKVHYIGWSEKYDEWLNFDSYRIAPLTRNNPQQTPSQQPEPSVKPSQSQTSPRTKQNAVKKLKALFSASARDEYSFRDALKRERNFEIVEMDNDGSCLFRAISHQVYGTADHHGLIREKCVDYIELESTFFRDFIVGDIAEFQSYCENMRKEGVWGDNVEIQALSEIYGRPIEIYAYQTSPMKTYRVGAKPPIRLSYHFQSHYNSIINPDTHHKTIVSEQPGEMEDEKIQLSELRSRHAHDQSIRLSALEATELEFTRNALSQSRCEFENQNAEDLDKAVYDSLQLFEKERSEKLNRDLKKAKEASLKELPSHLDYDYDRALSESVATVNNTALTRVIEESTLDAESQWPHAVRHCHSVLGFDLETCVEAYSLFGNQASVSEDVIISNMTNYIISQRTFGGFV